MFVDISHFTTELDRRKELARIARDIQITKGRTGGGR